MKIWKYIPVLAAIAVMLPACIGDLGQGNVDENPDDAVKITYLGKGFQADKTVYGDLFSVEADGAFMYDYLVMSKSTLRSKYGTLVGFVLRYPSVLAASLEKEGRTMADYLVSGSGTYAYGVLPEGTYTFFVIEMTPEGEATGICYTKEFTVGSYLSYEMEGKLDPQAGWKAEYLGRYEDKDAAGKTIYCDRISTSGTGDALYYHVICPAGFIKTSEDLLEAFRKGAGTDDLNGGEGLIEWYKMLAPSYNYLVGLDALLAKGGKDSDSGFMDYTLGTPSTGTFDVYTVEMLLNGHITGRYGKTTLEITGTPNIKSLGGAATASRAIRRVQVKK